MSFDSLALHLVIHELRDTILNGTIRHVEQLNPHSITIKVGRVGATSRSRLTQSGENEFLLISAHSTHARTHLIRSRQNAQKRSHFADFLVTHINRGEITAIEQVGLDRVLKISIQPKSDDPIERAPKALIAEFMGKHSNIILINAETGVILESIKHIDETMNRYREILPGLPYTPPPQSDKLHPLTLEYEQFISLVECQSEIDWRMLFKHIDGLSPTLAKEIIARSGHSPTLEQLWEAYQQVIAPFDPARSAPQVLINVGEASQPRNVGEASQPRNVGEASQSRNVGEASQPRPDVVAVSPMKLYHLPHSDSQPFDTMNEALNDYYDTLALKEAVRSERHALNQVLDKLMTTTDRKIAALNGDLATAEKAEDYRIKGELLKAHLHLVDRGQTTVEVQNYYHPELSTIQIELDPELSPSDNAQQYFKRYKKATRGLSIISQLIASNEAEQTVFLNYAEEVEAAEALEQLGAIREELVKSGWIKDKKQKQGNQSETAGAFRKYTSPQGFQIYVGRNSKENDLLLREIATSRDMWLHAKQIHGSHVIIRNPENKPSIPMPTLLQAAQIAASNSKARHSSYVPVDYTWARYVSKRKGNAAGFVHYTREKTLYVEPKIPNTE